MSKTETPQHPKLFGQGPRWEFYSPRLKRPVNGRGTLLLDHFVTLECLPELTSYEPFPTLTIELNGKVCTTLATSLETYRDGHRRVSTLRRAAPNENSEFDAVRVETAWAKANGCTPATLTAREIRPGDMYLFNCRTILPWLADLHAPTPSESRDVVGILVLQSAPVTIGRLAQLAKVPPEVAVAVVARAYVSGLIAIDDIRTRPLGYGTTISAKVGEA